MSKAGILILFLGTVFLFVVGLFLSVKIFKPKMAGLNINTTPTATVLINNQEVGKTPYKDYFKPGKYLVRIIPESSDTEFEAFDVELNLSAGIETVVRRNFGKTEESSSGYTVSFEKVGVGETSFSVISQPDMAEVILNGQNRALTPYQTSSITPGELELKLRADGYQDMELKAKAHKGYQLVISAKLARGRSQATDTGTGTTPSVSVSPAVSPSPALTDKGMGFVEIVNTPTGFLRIRSEASTLGSEVGQAKPGDKFVLTGMDEKTGWYKIEFTDPQSKATKTGWVSNQYAKKISN